MLAAAALLASCQKEVAVETVQQPEGVKTYLTIGLPSQTKTHMGDSEGGQRQVFWSDGDRIAVNGSFSAELENVPANSSSATFSFNGVISTPYSIIYPASIYTDATHVTLPAVQTYKSDGFADGMFPMAGYSADGSGIELKYLCSLVKIQVKRASANADVDNIVAVRFKGRNSEKVSGDFVIDYATPALTAANGTGAELEVRSVKSQESSTSTVLVYYLVVPARTYSNGFDIIVQDSNGHTMTKSKESSWTAAPGKLYNMPEFEFVPTGTELGVEIATAQDLIDFATAYNNKEYGADLIATVTADITFDATSSAAFNATGGIGLKIAAGDSEDYYFEGIFEGGNHSIKNLEATVPIFKATNSYGKVQNLRLASTCSFTFTHGNTAEADFGSVVGYHKGLLKSVTSYANVTIEPGDITQVTALGGLVGRVTVGTVDVCDYSGNLTVPSGFSVTGKLTHIGGLVGEITNAAGVIKNSYFYGTLETEARVSSTDKTNPYLFVGGIVGSNLTGTVRDCAVTANTTKVVTMANSTDYEGTLINHTTLAYHMAQGGIAGQNSGTVENCSNGATTQNFVLTTGANGTAADANSRYYDLGGIVGLNKAGATVSGCVNEGPIESRSTPRIQKIGGVVGYNLGTVSSCSNTVDGTIYLTTTNISPYSVRVGEVGGVIGNNSGTVSEISNAGDIRFDRTENAVGVELKFGGVIGLSTTAIDGGGSKSISNTGNFSDEYNGSTVTTAGLRFGGIVGSAQASVQNVVNSGNVIVTLSHANVMSKLYMGGIAGEINSSADVTVSGCENEGEVFFNVNSKAAAHSGNYIGGIVGLFTTSDDVTASISNCNNSGYIHSTCNGTTAVTDINVGGIAGYLSGSSDVTISNCNNNHSADDEGKVHLLAGPNSDNNVGGILGYSATNVAISNSTNNGLATYQLNAVLENVTVNGCVGGIMGTLASDKTASLSNCTNNGEVFFNNNGKGGTKDTDTGKYTDTYSGGIIAKGAGVTLSECTNNGYVHGGNSIKHNSTSCYTGGIVAHISGASSISQCTNTAIVYNDQFTNTVSNAVAAYSGGIAAYVLGSDSSHITISECEHNTSDIGPRRGYAGGIVGYANYADISDCTTGNVNMAGSAWYLGGIAGWVQNGDITGCTFSGGQIYSTQLQANGGGGIAAKLDSCTVDGCESNVTDIFHCSSGSTKDADVAGGAIVGISGSGNTIRNCHYKPTINSATANIAGTGSFTDGGGNAADLP